MSWIADTVDPLARLSCTEWLFTASDRTGQHRTTSDPHRARTGPEMTDYFTSTTNWKAYDELIIRNWLKKWTVIDARDELVTDVFNVSCLFSWSPSTVGSLLCLNFTRNSRQSEIISHFRLGTGPVRWIVTPFLVHVLCASGMGL